VSCGRQDQIVRLRRPTVILSGCDTRATPVASFDEMLGRLQSLRLSLQREKPLYRLGRVAWQPQARGPVNGDLHRLGFIFICSELAGKFNQRRSLARSDAGQLQAISATREREHGHASPIPQQGRWLRQSSPLLHYHAVPTNSSDRPRSYSTYQSLRAATLRSGSIKTGQPGS